MPRRPLAEGAGDGGHDTDRVQGIKRANARAHSKEKKDAAGPKSSKKRTAPAGAGKIKAAKKKKTSANACQVRSERNTAGANIARTGSAINNI